MAAEAEGRIDDPDTRQDGLTEGGIRRNQEVIAKIRIIRKCRGTIPPEGVSRHVASGPQGNQIHGGRRQGCDDIEIRAGIGACIDIDHHRRRIDDHPGSVEGHLMESGGDAVQESRRRPGDSHAVQVEPDSRLTGRHGQAAPFGRQGNH